MESEYSERSRELRDVIYDYGLPLGIRLTAWAEWCALFDEKEAGEDVQRDDAREYTL